MNYEALGRYHAVRQERETALRRLQLLAAPVRALAMDLEHYHPPYPNDLLPGHLADVAAVLPDIRTLQDAVTRQYAEMERLRTEYNLTP